MLSDASSEESRQTKNDRKKKDKKRQHKSAMEKDEYSKESFKKMKEEIDELRKNEQARAKELEELKKRVEDKEKESKMKNVVEYALEFDKDIYLKKGFIESAQWVKTVLAANMSEKMNEEKNKSKFEAFFIAKQSSLHLGMRTCARFNRGEECNHGKWHLTYKTEPGWPSRADQLWTSHGAMTYQQHKQQRQQSTQMTTEKFKPAESSSSKRNEIRLHACTLCMDTLGTAFGHSLLNCPWILAKNWNDNA